MLGQNAVYLDNCATTQICPESAQMTLYAMTYVYGNPSSLHTLGIEAEKLMKDSRRDVAKALSCESNEIIFTSGGTESNNLAIFGAASALKRRGKRIVTSSIEHSSVLGPMDKLEQEGYEVIRLKPNEEGTVSRIDLINAITPDTILVSLMLVNNETGTIQPVEAAKKAVEKVGSPALIHCDAVQAFCKVPVRPEKLGVDLLTVSSHKIHGPKGAGALYIRKGARILPVNLGGGQENGLRPGTEPVPVIAGFAEAARVAYQNFNEYTSQIQGLRDYCLNQLEGLPEITVNSFGSVAPHVLNVSIDGIRSEIMLHYLAEAGIYVSSGSACSKGKKSHVLASMGLSDSRIDSAIRISFSRYNSIADIDRLASAIKQGIAEIEKTH